MPSLNAAADTTFALSTITKGSIQVNATHAGWRGQEQRNDLGTRDRFSRRLQLDPGLVPPTSWSLSPCYGPKFHLRANGRFASRAPSFEFTVWSAFGRRSSPT